MISIAILGHGVVGSGVAEVLDHNAKELAIIKQMSRQVSRGSAVNYQADEQAGVARLSCRLSSR